MKRAQTADRPRQLGGALLVLAVLGCGGGAVVQQAPTVPPARKEAVGKMMRAVDSAEEGHSRGRYFRYRP